MRYAANASVVALAALLAAGTAQAAFVIGVTGTPGSGQTTWTFSGSSTVGGGTITIDDDDDNISWGWIVGTAFYSGTNINIDFSSTNAILSDGTTTYDIVGIGATLLDPNKAFGIAIEDAGASSDSYSFAGGTVLSFAGSAIAPLDFGDLNEGANSVSEWGDYTENVQGTLPGTINVGDVSTTPVAPTLTLTSLGIAGLAGVRRRRRSG